MYIYTYIHTHCADGIVEELDHVLRHGVKGLYIRIWTHINAYTYIYIYTHARCADGILEELGHVLRHGVKSLFFPKKDFVSDQVYIYMYTYVCMHMLGMESESFLSQKGLCV